MGTIHGFFTRSQRRATRAGVAPLRRAHSRTKSTGPRFAFSASGATRERSPGSWCGRNACSRPWSRSESQHRAGSRARSRSQALRRSAGSLPRAPAIAVGLRLQRAIMDENGASNGSAIPSPDTPSRNQPEPIFMAVGLRLQRAIMDENGASNGSAIPSPDTPSRNQPEPIFMAGSIRFAARRRAARRAALS